jgi:hypothetical protein
MLVERINARGHRNVLSRHRTTFEVTRDEHLTEQGDCIVAVGADKAMPELSADFKDALRKEGAVLKVTIRCGDAVEKATAYGHPHLILTHPTDLVVRKSDFICPRTLAVKADKAAVDFSRELIKNLQLGLPAEVEFEVA